ncbi:hypothetical protein ACEPAI_6202 [Sanghuangporus weigelae]
MSALFPPASRPRIHSVSTGVRPPLSISTLARSPAVSFAAKELADSDSSSQPSSQADSIISSSASSPLPSPAFILPPRPSSKNHSDATRGLVQSMFPVLVSRTVDLWRTVRSKDGKHSTNLFSSPVSSPRSSTETEYILPLSASPQKSAFDAADLNVPSRPQSPYRLVPFPSVHASLLFVIILFPISSALVFFCMSTLPITFAWPRTLFDLAQLGRDLSLYSRSGFTSTAHIVSVLVISAVWKHAWSIPGSVLWNVLAGALFHPLLATLLMTVTTSVGSVFATLLATPLAPVLTRAFPRPIELTRAALEGSSFSTSNSVQPEESKTFSVATSSSDSSPAWVRLSILRLVGIVPWSALNIACGLTGVALRDCLAGAFIGCLPWTAVTCQIGDILQAVNKARTTATEVGVDDGISNTATVSSVLAQPSMIFELVFLTILSLAPILFRDRLRRLIPSSDEASTDVPETEESEEKEVTVRSIRRGRPNALELPSLDDEEKDLDPTGNERRGRHLQRQRWTWKRLSMSVPRWNTLNSPLRSSFAHVDRDAAR